MRADLSQLFLGLARLLLDLTHELLAIPGYHEVTQGLGGCKSLAQSLNNCTARGQWRACPPRPKIVPVLLTASYRIFKRGLEASNLILGYF